MVVDEMLQTIRNLNKKGLQTINLYNCWLRRRLGPLASRDYYMYEYTGKNDPTKSCLVEWRLNDYTLALKKITQVVYLDAKAGSPLILQGGQPQRYVVILLTLAVAVCALAVVLSLFVL